MPPSESTFGPWEHVPICSPRYPHPICSPRVYPHRLPTKVAKMGLYAKAQIVFPTCSHSVRCRVGCRPRIRNLSGTNCDRPSMSNNTTTRHTSPLFPTLGENNNDIADKLPSTRAWKESTTSIQNILRNVPVFRCSTQRRSNHMIRLHHEHTSK